MRSYSFTAWRHGGAMNWPGKYLTGRLNSRATAILLFRKWFGREPSFSWGANFMAEAWDKRGNRIEITQYNEDPRRVRPRNALKQYRYWQRQGSAVMAADWHRELLRIPALTWPEERRAAK